MSVNDRILPNRVRYWRLKRGLTLKQVAPTVKLAFAHLSKIELGERELNQETMGRIATGLELLPADLLNVDDGGLTEDERLLVDTYREMPELGRISFDSLRDGFRAYQALRKPSE